MKKLLALAFFVAVLTNAKAQSVSLPDMSITTNNDTVKYDKGRIQIGKPFTQGDSLVVALSIEQWKQISPTDIISRRRTVIAPASLLTILSFNALTMQVTYNKAALNQILSAYGLNIIVQ